MNRKRMQAVIDQIEAHPETWDQGSWRCGSKACFAGWAENHAKREAPAFYDAIWSTRMVAIHWLALADWEANWLFASSRKLGDFKQFLLKGRLPADALK